MGVGTKAKKAAVRSAAATSAMLIMSGVALLGVANLIGAGLTILSFRVGDLVRKENKP